MCEYKEDLIEKQALQTKPKFLNLFFSPKSYKKPLNGFKEESEVVRCKFMKIYLAVIGSACLFFKYIFLVNLLGYID